MTIVKNDSIQIGISKCHFDLNKNRERSFAFHAAMPGEVVNDANWPREQHENLDVVDLKQAL